MLVEKLMEKMGGHADAPAGAGVDSMLAATALDNMNITRSTRRPRLQVSKFEAQWKRHCRHCPLNLARRQDRSALNDKSHRLRSGGGRRVEGSM
jgi:hypothetical protein